MRTTSLCLVSLIIRAKIIGGCFLVLETIIIISINKYAFAPKSALSALSAMRINTITPSEHAPDNLNRYRQLNKHRNQVRSDVRMVKSDISFLASSESKLRFQKKQMNNLNTVRIHMNNLTNKTKKQTIFINHKVSVEFWG